MANYTLNIRPHYSGLLMGQCVEEPDFTVIGRDHEEVASLADAAFSAGELMRTECQTVAGEAEETS